VGDALRVLHVLGPSTGGIRRHVAALADAQRRRGATVTVAGPLGVLDGLGPLDHAVRLGPAAVGRLWRWQRSVDVVHAHGLRAGWVAAAVPGRRPLVVTVHNLVLDEAAGRRAPALRRLEGALPRRVDLLIAPSEPVAHRFAAASPGDVRVIAPVGVVVAPARGPAAVRDALGVAPGAPLVVGLGRLHPQKGWPTLVLAARRLAEDLPAVRVVIAGDGPERYDLEARIRSAGLEAVVSLPGPVDDTAGLLATADAVAIPSIWESGPLVLLEALTMGRPVVATPVGFVPVVLTDGVDGRIVPVGDAAALAGALGGLLADRSAAERMGSAGQARAAVWFDADALVDAVEDAYRAAMDRRR
jgi:glycosyltransferase involved in cell wall biosynthesis